MLQSKMSEMGWLDKPQYIGYQRHILDRILQGMLDSFVSQHSTKSTLSYEFINEIVENFQFYHSVHKEYIANDTVIRN